MRTPEKSLPLPNLSWEPVLSSDARVQGRTDMGVAKPGRKNWHIPHPREDPQINEDVGTKNPEDAGSKKHITSANGGTWCERTEEHGGLGPLYQQEGLQTEVALRLSQLKAPRVVHMSWQSPRRRGRRWQELIRAKSNDEGALHMDQKVPSQALYMVPGAHRK